MERNFAQNDIPYSTLQKDRQGYEILLLRDRHSRSFSAIARELGISAARARQQYSKIKVRQVRLYLRHISIALGHENTTQMRKIFFAAMECYQNYACACGYLEKKYGDILEKYRGEEPGMAEDFLNRIPPFKDSLSIKEISRLVAMREESKATFRAIGRELEITPEKARHTYEMVYHRKLLACVKQLQAQAQDERERREIWLHYLDAHGSAKTRYERLLEETNK